MTVDMPGRGRERRRSRGLAVLRCPGTGGMRKRAQLLIDWLGRVRQKSEIYRYISYITISILLGVFAGSGAILFHYLLEKMRSIFEPPHFSRVFSVSNVFIFVLPVLGGIIMASMTRYMPALARQQGVVSVIKALIIKNGYISPRVTLFHLVAPIICIGTGAPLGPEGPAAKIGSGFGSFMSQTLGLTGKEMRMYTAAGAGAAISAVFNAPIAGVFFGIEVILLNDLKNQALSGLIISSVVADILSRAVLGNKHVFSIPSYQLGSIGDYPFFLLLGIFCGVLSVLYFGMSRFFGDLLNNRLKITNEYLKLLPVCLIFGVVLIKYHQLYGIGYNTINDVIASRIPFETIGVLLILKIVFVALFLRAGSNGGIFAPALMIGVMLGYCFAVVVNFLFATHLNPVVFALVGMGGVLSGINSIPLTSMMLVFEVTNDYRFILPLMLVSVIAYLVVTYVNGGTTYALELREDGIDVSKRGEMDLLGKIKVKELKRTDMELVNYRTPFRDLMQNLLDSSYGDVFVVDDHKELYGIVSLKEVRQALISSDLVDLLIAGDISTPVPTVSEEDPVSLAIQRIEEYDIETIPIVRMGAHRNITGFLTRQDILRAYNKQLDTWETDQFLGSLGGKK